MADADLGKTYQEERDTHSRQRHLSLPPSQTHYYSPSRTPSPSFFLTTLRISPLIKRHNFPRRRHTQHTRRRGNIVPIRAAEKDVAAAPRRLARRGHGEDRVRRIDRDTVGRNTDEALDGLAIWKVYRDAKWTLRLFLSICRVWPRRVHAGPRALSYAIPRD
jgi:hypothetical protein